MCGHRCHRGRAPIVVVLGKLAYDKYQERKARNIAETSVNRARSPSPYQLESQANAEIMEKAGITPPSYHQVMVNRAMIPEPRVQANEKAIDWNAAKGFTDEIDEYSDDEDHHQVANGMTHSRVGMDGPVTPLPVRSSGQSKWQQKKAERAARKAREWAVKAAYEQSRM